MRTCSLLAILLGLGASASGQAPPFSQHPSSPVTLSDYARDIEIADFDSDGRGDVVVTLETGPDLRVFMQSSTGTFSGPGTAYGTHDYWMIDVDIVDIDGDGDPDLVGYQPLANQFASPPEPDQAFVTTWLNSSGTLTEQAPVEVGDDVDAGRIAAFDFDGDGDQDLGRVANGTLHLLENNGAGVYAAEVASGSSYDSCVALGAGDVDADGDMDVLLKVPDEVGVTLNDGTGAFTDSGLVSQSTGSYPSIAVADLGTDGYPDFVTGYGGFYNAGINGGGNFTEVGLTYLLPASTFTDPSIGLWDLRVVDVDGDFNLDLVAGASNQTLSSTITAYGLIAMGDGVGNFGGTVAFPGTTENPPFGDAQILGVAVGDIDGDLWTDFVNLERNINAGGRFRAYINGSTEGWQDLGYALSGVAGPPRLSATGSLTSSFTLTLVHANPTPYAYMMFGFHRHLPPQPFHSGFLVPIPYGSLGITQVPTNPSGGFTLSSTGSPASGVNLFLQVWIKDLTGPDGFAASNAIVEIVP